MLYGRQFMLRSRILFRIHWPLCCELPSERKRTFLGGTFEFVQYDWNVLVGIPIYFIVWVTVVHLFIQIIESYLFNEDYHFKLLISSIQFRILSDMRTLSADWMANTSKSESGSLQQGGEESKANFFYPRPVAPTAAQVSRIIKFFHAI